MKILSRELKSIIIAIFAICITFVSPSFAEEMGNGQEHGISLYNLDAQEQSVLFTFLQERFFLESVASLLECNDACDYCVLRDDLAISYNGDFFPEPLKKLGFEKNDSSKNSKNCNFCDFLYCESLENIRPVRDHDDAMMPHANRFIDISSKGDTHKGEDLIVSKYYELCLNVFDKLRELQKAEYPRLVEQFKFTEDEMKLFYQFKISELEECIEFYEEVDYLLRENGNFPNSMDQINIMRVTAANILDLLEMVKNKEVGVLMLNIEFAGDLLRYNQFLKDNIDVLFNVEAIADNGFKIEDPKCKKEQCPMREIKTLSELLVQAEKWIGSEKILVEERLKDIL